MQKVAPAPEEPAEEVANNGTAGDEQVVSASAFVRDNQVYAPHVKHGERDEAQPAGHVDKTVPPLCVGGAVPPSPAPGPQFDRREEHVHESADSPPFDIGTLQRTILSCCFLFQTFIHFFQPWSLPLYMWVYRDSPVHSAQVQAFLPVREVAGSVPGIFFGWIPNLFVQAFMVLAFLGYAPYYGRDEAVLSVCVFLAHRCAVGAKYAGLSGPERERMLHGAPYAQAALWSARLQVVTGWFSTPSREVILAELELASAHEGVDLPNLWVAVHHNWQPPTDAPAAENGGAAPDVSVPVGGGGGSGGGGGGGGELEKVVTAAAGEEASDGARELRPQPTLKRKSTLLRRRSLLGAEQLEEPKLLSFEGESNIEKLHAFLAPARDDPLTRSLYSTELWYGRSRDEDGPPKVHVNAGALAVALLHSAFTFTDRLANNARRYALAAGLLQGFLPAIVRHVNGEPPFGGTPLARWVFAAMFFVRVQFIFVLILFGLAAGMDSVRRWWVVWWLGATIRLPHRLAYRPGAAGAAAADAVRVSLNQVSHEAARMDEYNVPLVDMQSRHTAAAWLHLRLALMSFGERFRARVQSYFACLLSFVAADLVWQLYMNRARFKAHAGSATPPIPYGGAAAILFCVPAAMALMLQLVAAVSVNNTFAAHREALLQQRLLLLEWAPRAPRGDGTHANPRWLVDVDCERMLEVASAVVEASPRMRVLGIEATDTVLKAYVSLLGTAVVFFAALLTSSSSSIYQVASGADAAASSAGGAR